MNERDITKDYIIGFFGAIWGGLALFALTEFKNSGVCFEKFNLIGCIFSGGIYLILIVIFFIIGLYGTRHVVKKSMSNVSSNNPTSINSEKNDDKVKFMLPKIRRMTIFRVVYVIGVILSLGGLYLLFPGIFQAALVLAGAIIFAIGFYLLAEGKHLIPNQAFLLIGSIFLLSGQSSENITALFNYLRATDLFTIGSFAFIIGIFIYEKARNENTSKVNFYLSLCAISPIFLFIAGFALTVPYIFANPQSGLFLVYNQKLSYLTTAFIFVGLLDLVFSSAGFAYMVETHLKTKKSRKQSKSLSM